MAFRNIQAGMATYRGHGGDRGDAYYAHPTNAGPHPGVVVIHHMPGWDEWTCEVARKFAHHGYAAIAPSLYFRVGDGADEAVVTKVREGGGIPDEQMLGDVTGAIDFLRSQPHASGKVGVIGFCSGGRQTYLVACKLSHLVQSAVDCWGGNVVVDDKSRLTKAQPVAPRFLRSLSSELPGRPGDRRLAQGLWLLPQASRRPRPLSSGPPEPADDRCRDRRSRSVG
jgi:carboxymethylenebutenolidase